MWTTTSGLTGNKLRIAITVTAVMGFSLFGYDQGLMSGLISGEQFNITFPETYIPEDASDSEAEHVEVVRGAVTACYEIGCFFGAIFTLIYGDKIGRTRTVFGGGIILIIGAIISTCAFENEWALGTFVVGRVISGLGNGANTATIPIWQSETSQAKNRGLLVCLEGAVIAVGTFIAYWIDFGLSYVDSTVQWRFPVAFQIFFALILVVGIYSLPESPRWLVRHGYENEACKVLAALHVTTPDDEAVISDLMLMKADAERNVSGGYGDLFKFGKTQQFSRMMIGSSTQFFQQFTGCNAAIYYSTILFENTIGLDHRLSLVLGGVFATIYALATIPGFFMIEKVGRRKLFLIGFLGQGLSFIITFGCLVDPVPANARGAAVGIYLFIVFFAFTILPLPWIYPPEVNPLRTRTPAVAVSTCTNWICNFAVVMFTPVFSQASGWGLYLFFALVNLLAVPVAWFFYPETAGRHLEEIDIIFAKAYVEGKWPFQVANNMPYLELDQLPQMARELGLRDVGGEDIETAEKGDSSDEVAK